MPSTFEEFLTADPNTALARIEAAILAGASEVRYGGNVFKFRSVEELRQIQADLKRQINGKPATPRFSSVSYHKHGR